MDSLKYVILDENNKVINIIIADSVEHAEELTGSTAVAVANNVKVFQGDDYDGTAFSNAERDAYELALAQATAEGEAAKAAEAEAAAAAAN